MGKMDVLGAQKRRPNKRRLIKKVLSYLKSNHFMFAPFIREASGLEIQQRIKQSDKKVVQKVEDYLRSDSFMYASLIVPQPSNAPAGQRTVLFAAKNTHMVNYRSTK